MASPPPPHPHPTSTADDEEEEEEEEEENGDDDDAEGITEYEKQRLQTIQRNKAVLAALRLPALASTLTLPTTNSTKPRPPRPAAAGGQRRRSERVNCGRSSVVYDESASTENSNSDSESDPPGPRKSKLNDREYEPSASEGSQSESEDEVDVREVEEGVSDRHNTFAVPTDIDMDEEELALQQALALSLGASLEEASDRSTALKKGRTKKRAVQMDNLPSLSAPAKVDCTPKRRKQKLNNTKLQFTSGEVESLFSLFDERGRGRLTAADIESVSSAHDFTWSKEELQEMIHFFDSNHDGMLDVSDLRSIAVRCNLIRPEG